MTARLPDTGPDDQASEILGLRERVAALETETARLARALREATGQAEASAGDSGEMLRLAQEAGGICSWQWDVRTGALRWSDSCHRLHGTDPGEPPSYGRWFAGIHAQDRPSVEAALTQAIQGGSDSWDIEFRYNRHDDGAERWLVGRGRIVRDPATGDALRLLGIGLDITERKMAEERQALLMRELDHRARNLLSVVQAALRLTPKDDPQQFARAVEGRIAALARAHAMLAEARWTGSDLRALIEGELAAFLDARRILLEGPPVTLPLAVTQALAMAVHELATNAVKHGALSAHGGRIAVGWQVAAPAEGGTPLLTLSWCESGGPPVVPPVRRGFGSRVLQATVSGQLQGSMTTDWSPAGLRCRMEIPLRQAARSG